MLRVTTITLVLCLTGIAWSETFEEEGGGIRGPRIMEPKAASDCKQDKNWPICADEDWGPKCPSGCRVAGLATQSDKEFGKRLDIIRQKFKDGEINYKSIDVRTKETYDSIKDNLFQAQQSDGKYNEVSENLRNKIEFLKKKVVNQVERIKALQRSVRDQVVEMKRLEVDIDIKLRSCKGSCAKSVEYHVDYDSYDNIQKQLLQAEGTDLRIETNTLRVLKMRPIKDSLVDPRYKTQAQMKDQEDQFKIFTDIDQFTFVLEGKPKQVTGEESSSTTYTSVSGKAVSLPTSKQVIQGGDKGTISGSESTHVISCTKTITKKTVQGPSGPREEIFESFSGGPECESLSKRKTEAKGEVLPDGTYNVKISGSGGVSKIPSLEEFISSAGVNTQTHYSSSSGVSGGTITKTSSSKIVDGFSDLGEDEIDDFHTFHGTPSFTPLKSQTSFTKTVVSGSDVGGSQWDTKYKSKQVFEDHGPLQQDISGEDTPDLQARSVRKQVKVVTSYTGTDCDDIRQKHSSGAKSGIFKIRPEGSNKVLSVYCDQDTELGGWLLIQQREDGSVNFNRTWEDYKNGFGSVDGNGKGDFYMGNEFIHLLTQKNSVLRIELEDWSGEKVYAEYNFHLGSESDGYVLRVSEYGGSAGDALIEGSKDDGEHTSHNGMKFSTFDRDSDKWEENCAEMYGGGWWHNNCQAANLNGIYYFGGHYDPRNNVPYEIENGVVWIPFKTADYSLKTVRMKIRPSETTE
ncbi:fibrinogen alpha chain [Pelobates cultripes]|uniref:Fibrinogen alpha chain n=1 Tax=Pelobates cultripes TaxID=61616 RepID=A0AAD1SGQ2_PELCU|nr:fibrinogen alpha chain [Pelobates cultripes]